MTFFTCLLLRSQVKTVAPNPYPPMEGGWGWFEGADVSRQSVRLDVTRMLQKSSQTVRTGFFYDRRLFAVVISPMCSIVYVVFILDVRLWRVDLYSYFSSFCCYIFLFVRKYCLNDNNKWDLIMIDTNNLNLISVKSVFYAVLNFV